MMTLLPSGCVFGTKRPRTRKTSDASGVATAGCGVAVAGGCCGGAAAPAPTASRTKVIPTSNVRLILMVVPLSWIARVTNYYTRRAAGSLVLLLASCGGGGDSPPPPPPQSPSPSAAAASPCAIADAAAPSAQTRARVGAYYFDGWSGPLSHDHFKGLVGGPFGDREPLTGWRDNDPCVIEQQLVWAREFGLGFFVYDWYFKAKVFSPNENLNSAIELTHALRDRHGMQYAILYVNHPPFGIRPADWASAVAEWTDYLADPDYLRIDGRPAFFVYNVVMMRDAFGSASAVANAFSALRDAARARGLPGVYVVGGFGVWKGSAGDDDRFPDYSWVPGDGYDALTMYGYSEAPAETPGEQPFVTLADGGRWIWGQVRQKSLLPFVPVVMDGWDPRPIHPVDLAAGRLMWFRRSPREVAELVDEAIAWVESSPRVRPEAAPAPPVVLIEAWNELSEGSYLVPTAGDGKDYGAALRSVLARDR